MRITHKKGLLYLNGVMAGRDQGIPQAECILVRARRGKPVDQRILAAQGVECTPDWQVYPRRALSFLVSQQALVKDATRGPSSSQHKMLRVAVDVGFNLK